MTVPRGNIKTVYDLLRSKMKQNRSNKINRIIKLIKKLSDNELEELEDIIRGRYALD